MKRILIVEDTDSIRREMRECLSQNPDFEIVEAEDGAKAMAILSQAQNPNFDLVLLDYHLPHTNGVDLLRQLMQAGKPVRCPIVMISTEFEARGSEIKALNVLAWIVKPIHRARLYNLVVQIFDAS